MEAPDASADGFRTLAIHGDLSAADARFEAAVQSALQGSNAKRVHLDLDGVSRLGMRGYGALEHVIDSLRAGGIESNIRTRREDLQQTLDILRKEPPPPLTPEALPPFYDQILHWTLAKLDGFLTWALLLRDGLLHAGRQLVFAPRGTRTLAIRSLRQIGSRAAGLVALIAGLIGVVLAIQGGKLLELYGQELLIADLVGLAMVKEIGPLVTAVLVAGRSGSALTAEIGTMKVTEEVDALEVMGVRPIAWLVAPRLIALAIALPLLTALADVVGIFGGLVVASLGFGVAPSAFFQEIENQVPWSDVASGLLKAFVFALLIVSIAAHQGFQTRGGAGEVGSRTTRAVVVSIVWVIVVNAIFTATEWRFG